MSSSYSYPIHSITLAGFQVFEKPTTIPLSKLTFLIGPNSAGKSAIEDALVILTEIYGDAYNKSNCGWLDGSQHVDGSTKFNGLLEMFGVPYTSRFERLNRHWRKTGEGINDYADRMHMGVTGYIYTQIASALASNIQDDFFKEPEEQVQWLGIRNEGAAESEVGIFTEFRLAADYYKDDIESIGALCDTELNINRVAATKIIENEKIGFNLNHWVFSHIAWEMNFIHLARDYPDQLSFDNGWFWLCADIVRGNKRLSLIYDFDGHWRDDVRLVEIASKFVTIYNELFSIVLGNWNPFRDKSLGVVLGSRQTPSDKDLTILIDSWESSLVDEQDIRRGLVNPLESFGFINTGDNQYQSLAISSLNTNDKDSLVNKVNKALQENLFVDKGYSLYFESLNIVYPHDLDRSIASVVKINLIDAKGRRFSFNDVGSGLGYILPVLCVIFGNSDLVVIHQPELHLHPALQAALGDVFIEGAVLEGVTEIDDEEHTYHSSKQLIIETHSEHVLLRILKRIRQTNANIYLPDELKVKPEDVCMLYFDPKIDGTTQVKRIRISEDGDFLDRWPKGFFGEREQELFDE